MMHAYDEQYLDDAMRNLGEAADYAVNACKMSLQKFFDLFVATGFATQFGDGVPKFVSGLSGTELVHEIIIKSGIEHNLPDVRTEYDCSPEYWCGWIVTYYQWYTGRTFKDIFQNISAYILDERVWISFGKKAIRELSIYWWHKRMRGDKIKLILSQARNKKCYIL